MVDAALAHASPHERPILRGDQARLVRPVLEESPNLEQPRHGAGRDGADSASKHKQVAPLDGGDRVELDAGEAAHAGFDVSLAGAPESCGEALPGDDVPPQIGKGKLDRSGVLLSRSDEMASLLLPIFAANTVS